MAKTKLVSIHDLERKKRWSRQVREAISSPRSEAALEGWDPHDFERYPVLEHKSRASARMRYQARVRDLEAERELAKDEKEREDIQRRAEKAQEALQQLDKDVFWVSALEAERVAEKAERADKARKDRRLQRVRPLLTRMQYRVFELKMDGLEDSEIATVLCTAIKAVREYRYEYRERLKEAEADGRLN